MLLCFSVVAQGGVARAQEDGGARPAVLTEVDRAVASVGGVVITDSQLQFEARVLLVGANGVEAALQPLDREALSRALQLIIDQRLATWEADRLQAYPLEAGEMDRAVEAFRARFLSEDRFRTFLAMHEVDLEGLQAVLRQKLRAEKVLDSKFRLRSQVSESEVARGRRDRPEWRDLPLEVVRQRLVADRFRELVRAELRQARRTVDVRLLGPFAPVPREEPR